MLPCNGMQSGALKDWGYLGCFEGAALITRPSRRRHPSLKMGSFFFCFCFFSFQGCDFATCAVRSTLHLFFVCFCFCTVMADSWVGLFSLQQETPSCGITFTCAPLFCGLKLWQNFCFYGTDCDASRADMLMSDIWKDQVYISSGRAQEVIVI